MLASVQICFQMLRDSMALSKSGPVAWPIGHIIPKLRMDAPTARSLRSNTVTLYPRKANARAVARPTMPAPIMMAEPPDPLKGELLICVSIIQVECLIGCRHVYFCGRFVKSI